MQDMTIAEEREFELRRDVTREATELWLSQAHELLHAASDIELAMEAVMDDLRASVHAAVSLADPNDQLLCYRESVVDSVQERVVDFLSRFEVPQEVAKGCSSMTTRNPRRKGRRRNERRCRTGKMRYRSQDQAIDHMHRMTNIGENGVPKRAYWGLHCKGWHLTKQAAGRVAELPHSEMK